MAKDKFAYDNESKIGLSRNWQKRYQRFIFESSFECARIIE